MVLTAGCSGPSVTSSDTSGTTDQALSVVKKDIDAKKDQTLVAGTVIRTSLQHALTTDGNAPGDRAQRQEVTAKPQGCGTENRRDEPGEKERNPPYNNKTDFRRLLHSLA